MAQEYAKDQPEGFINHIQKIAIVGAGGLFGKHLTLALLGTGKHTVTAITRPDSTNELPGGVLVSRVDYSGDDLTSLVEALREQQALIITMAVHAPQDSVIKIVRAAAQAGVKYVMPNWFGHDAGNKRLCDESFVTQSFGPASAEMERLGVSSSLKLVCNFWYEFSLGGGEKRYGFDFDKRTLTIFDEGKVPINTTTWPKCAKAVANLFSLKVLPEDESDKSTTLSQFRNKPIYISSFRVSQLDMFESVKRVTHTTDADWKITYEPSEQRWKDNHAAVLKGDFSVFAKVMYSRMFFPNGDGDYESSRGLDNEALGLENEDLDEFTAVGIRMALNGEVPY